MPQMIFSNYGGKYQLRIETPEDLMGILDLPEPHWAATSAPLEGLNCDPAFLDFLDNDENDRVRTDEIRAAVAWLFRMLSGRDRLTEQSDILRFDDIDASHAEGALLRDAAGLILSNLDLADEQEIALEHVRKWKRVIAGALNNGDGIIPPEAVDSPETAAFIKSVIDCVGSTADAGGKQGIGQKQIDAFLEEGQAFLDWEARGLLPEGQSVTDVLPWGDETAGAWEIVQAVEGKIEQFFSQCSMVRFDPRSAEEMRLREDELKETDFADHAVLNARLDRAPLALPNAEGALNLEGELNPFYSEKIAALRSNVLERALGRLVDELTRETWGRVEGIFAAHREWRNDKGGEAVEKLGSEAVRACLEGPHLAEISALISADEPVAEALLQIQNVEKLILFQRWMLGLANSFVSFSRLYDPTKRSLFEMGTLIIEGREITFTVGVEDRKAHRSLAEDCNMCILYLEVTGREDEAEKFEAAAAVTSGDTVGLQKGKRGVFFTTDGQEWDALVVDIIQNPVSLREAAKAPFKKAADFVAKQIDKIGKTQQAKIESAISGSKDTSAIRDLLLAGSVGLAALGSSFAYVTKAMNEVSLKHVVLTLVGIFVAVMGPSLVTGYFKLRSRDLTALLEASGWAVNFRIPLSRRLGLLFTRRPALPQSARKERRDRAGRLFDEINWPVVIALALAGAAIILGVMYRILVVGALGAQ